MSAPEFDHDKDHNYDQQAHADANDHANAHANAHALHAQRQAHASPEVRPTTVTLSAVEELMIEDDGRGRDGDRDRDHDHDRDRGAGDDTYSSFTRNSVPENSSSGKLYDDDDDNNFRGTLGALFSIQVQHTRTKHKA